MNHAERYSSETRTLLDLTAYELRRLGLLPGSRLAVLAAHPELLDDLADRLPGYHLSPALPDAETAAAVYLLSLEDGALLPTPAAPHLLVAFRNRLSHKTLLYRDRRALWYPAAEARLGRHYRLSRRWGVLGPVRVAGLLASSGADRAGRHDLGYLWADRALLAPTERGFLRYLSPLGLLVGSRK